LKIDESQALNLSLVGLGPAAGSGGLLAEGSSISYHYGRSTGW